MIIFIITIHLYCYQPPKEKTIEVLKDPALRDRILWRDNGFGAWLFVVILFFVMVSASGTLLPPIFLQHLAERT